MTQEKKKVLPPSKKAFVAKQLYLFQDFLCNTSEEKEQLSNTVELWDAVPKYYINQRRQDKLRDKGFLPTATRDFIFKGQHFTVKIRPARITVDNQDREYYPAAREELVEDALRKMACMPNAGFLEKDRSGVSFSLHQLREELKKQGHTLSYYQVVESLKILVNSTIEIMPLNDKALYITSPLTSLIGVSRDDLEADPKSRWYADFSSLVTEGIKQIKYRQYNYGLMMSFKSQLTRYLHKRLAHNYVQASLAHPYTITMQGIARDSGLLDCQRPKDNRRKIENSLNELVSGKVLINFDIKDIIRGVRNALVDIKYDLIPSHNFVTEVKRANKKISIDNDKNFNEI